MRYLSLMTGCITVLALLATSAVAQVTVFAADKPSAVANPMPHVQFEDGTGRSLGLDDFKGRYVLLNLWATWCGPCVEEMPSLDTLQRQFTPQKLAVVAVTQDHDGLNAAKFFYMRHNLKDLTLYADRTGQMPALLKAKGLPTSLLIDPQGREVARFEGGVNWMSQDMQAYLTVTLH